MSVELEVEEQLTVPNGEKEGEITKVEERTEPYHYIDVYVTCEGHDIPELRAGFPAKINPNTKLGRTLDNFLDLEEVMGQKVDLEEILQGKKVSYLTMTEEKDDGRKFVKVVGGSLKPIDQEEEKEPQEGNSEGKTLGG